LPEEKLLIQEFFRIFPDYLLCKTLVENIKENQTTYAEALRQLNLKVKAFYENRVQIKNQLNRRSVLVGNERIQIKDLRLLQMARLPNNALQEVLRFYFKNPYAHGRCKECKWIPSWFRTFALRYLIGQARSRGIQMEYSEYFELIRLL